MKNYKFLLLIAVITNFLLNSSCRKKWLEEKAQLNQAVPTDSKDFQAILDGTSVMNANLIAIGEIAADGHYVTDIVWQNASSSNARNAYTWSHNLPYSLLSSWDFTYRRIFQSNVVLDGVLKAQSKSIDEKQALNYVKGQALFNRAFCFFSLAQLYSQPYFQNMASSDVGIPLRLNSDVSLPSKRASVEDTYSQIIKDTKEAATLLSNIESSPTRPTKPAAYGLLARTYLVMGNFDSSLLYADKCLQIYDQLIDYNTETTNTQSNLGLFNKEVIFHDRMYTSELSGFVSTNYLIDADLYEQYELNDLRKTRFFRINANSTISFKGNYNNSASTWFCGIATDEIFLIRSECYARLGNLTNALLDLNKLLRKRYDMSYVDYSSTNADDVLKKILLERQKELILRNLRWSDLRRLNVDDRFMVTLTRTIGSNTYTLEPNSYKYTFPIPDDILAISNLAQTPGW